MPVSCIWVTLAAAATATGLSAAEVSAFGEQAGSTYYNVCADGTTIYVNQTLVDALTP